MIPGINFALHRPYVHRACHRCKNRRAKCDGDRPQCRRCKHNHVECKYPPSGYDDLQELVKQLQAEIRRITNEMDMIRLRRDSQLQASMREPNLQIFQNSMLMRGREAFSMPIEPFAADQVIYWPTDEEAMQTMEAFASIPQVFPNFVVDDISRPQHYGSLSPPELIYPDSMDESDSLSWRRASTVAESIATAESGYVTEDDVSFHTQSNDANDGNDIEDSLILDGKEVIWRLQILQGHKIRMNTNFTHARDLYGFYMHYSPPTEINTSVIPRNPNAGKYGEVQFHHYWEIYQFLAKMRRNADDSVPLTPSLAFAHKEADILAYIIELYFTCQPRMSLHRKTFFDYYNEPNPPPEHTALVYAIACRWTRHSLTYHREPNNPLCVFDGDIVQVCSFVERYFFGIAREKAAEYMDTPHPYIIHAFWLMADYLITSLQKKKAILFHQVAIRLAMNIKLHEVSNHTLQRGQMSLQDRRTFVLWTALMDRETNYEDMGEYVSSIPADIRVREPPDLRSIIEGDDDVNERTALGLEFSFYFEKLTSISKRMMSAFYMEDSSTARPVTKEIVDTYDNMLDELHSSLPPFLSLDSNYRFEMKSSFSLALNIQELFYVVRINFYRLSLPSSTDTYPNQISLRSLTLSTEAACMLIRINDSYDANGFCAYHLSPLSIAYGVLINTLEYAIASPSVLSADIVQQSKHFLVKVLAIMQRSFDYQMNEPQTHSHCSKLRKTMIKFGIPYDDQAMKNADDHSYFVANVEGY